MAAKARLITMMRVDGRANSATAAAALLHPHATRIAPRMALSRMCGGPATRWITAALIAIEAASKISAVRL